MAVDSKKTVVVDASAILSVLLGDENQPPKIKQALKDYANGQLDLIAPVLLKIEVGNTLRSAFLQKRLTPVTAKSLYQKFLELPIQYFESINFQEVLKSALKQNLSFYDAVYFHLSKKLNLELLTLDKKLNKTISKSL